MKIVALRGDNLVVDRPVSAAVIPRVDPVGLDLGVTDRLHILRVGEAQINPGGPEQVAQPVPALHALDDYAVRASERAE